MDELVIENMRLVPFIVNKYYRDAARMLGDEDLISVGYIGLIKAARDFDPSSGLRFATCAGKYIRTEIYRYVRANRSMLHIPCHAAQKMSADALEQFRVSSYDAADAEDIHSLRSMQDGAEPIDSVSATSIDFQNAMLHLSERKRQIVKAYIRCGSTRKVAAEMGVSSARVHQIIVEIRELYKNPNKKKKRRKRK